MNKGRKRFLASRSEPLGCTQSCHLRWKSDNLPQEKSFYLLYPEFGMGVGGHMWPLCPGFKWLPSDVKSQTANWWSEDQNWSTDVFYLIHTIVILHWIICQYILKSEENSHKTLLVCFFLLVKRGWGVGDIAVVGLQSQVVPTISWCWSTHYSFPWLRIFLPQPEHGLVSL